MPGEKPLGARTRTNNKLNPHMRQSPGIKHGPHWWEASALTTVPSLLPLNPSYGDNIHHKGTSVSDNSMVGSREGHYSQVLNTY